jgi:diaminopimelate decarboxylase
MTREDLLYIAQAAETPLYVYDEENIREKFKELKKVFSSFDTEIHYAMKANENPEILQIIKEFGGGIDAVSPNEIKRALEVGFSARDIVFTPSFPDESEIDFAIEKGVNIHAGDTYVLDYFLENFSQYSLGIRINPETPIEGNQKIATAHSGSKFGIPLTEMPYIHSLIKKGLKVNTLHIHTGSDVKNWQDLAKSVDVLFDLVKDFPQVSKLDLGSGFKVKYGQNSAEIDLHAYSQYIKNKLEACKRSYKIIFEPGKYLVSESGYFLMRVNGVKQGYQKRFAGVNSGFHHFIRPMYYDAYHEIVNLSNPMGKVEKYDIVGQLCEEDTFAYNRELPEIRKGDILAIKNAGAYGYSMSSEYNLRDKPKEVIWRKGSIKNINL